MQYFKRVLTHVPVAFMLIVSVLEIRIDRDIVRPAASKQGELTNTFCNKIAKGLGQTTLGERLIQRSLALAKA